MKEHGTYHHGQHRSMGDVAPCCQREQQTNLAILRAWLLESGADESVWAALERINPTGGK